VPFKSVHAAGKYTTKDKSKTDTNKLNTTQQTNNTKHSRTKLTWFSRFLRHSARKRGELILQSSRANIGLHNISDSSNSN